MSQLTTRPQIDTDPPAEWVAQPEAFPYVLDDTQTAPPVPRLYLPKYTPVHNLPSERLTTATYELGIAQPIQVVNKSEQGIGFRVTLTVSPVGGNIAIANSQEALLQTTTPNAPLTSYIKGAFVIPAGPSALTISTCDELWAICLTTGALTAAWVSVLQEQFYGD